MLSIDRDSRQFVQAQVAATVAGQPYNPTTDTVEFAFATGTGRPDTWYTGSWTTATISGTNTYWAQILIGPGGSGPVLTVGRYFVWIRITDNPEQPVIPVGWLAIT